MSLFMALPYTSCITQIVTFIHWVPTLIILFLVSSQVLTWDEIGRLSSAKPSLEIHLMTKKKMNAVRVCRVHVSNAVPNA